MVLVLGLGRFALMASPYRSDRAHVACPFDCSDQAREVDLWFAVSFMCQKPWKPTLLPMERFPEEDRPDLLGLTPARGEVDGKPRLRGLTLWSALRQLDLDLPYRLNFYTFFADSARRVVAIRPWRQRVAAISEEQSVWAGKAEELANLRAEDARRRPRGGRAGRGQGRGGRRGGRGEPADVHVPLALEEGVVDEVAEDGGPPEAEGEVYVFGALADDDIDEGNSGEGDNHDAEQSSATDASSDMGEEWDIGEVDLEVELEALLHDRADAVDAADAAEPPEPPPPAPPPLGGPAEEFGEELAIADSVIRDGDLYSLSFAGRGCIKYYFKTKIFVAECWCPLHMAEGRCHLTRQATASTWKGREGAGRPLGLMMAWIFTCPAAFSRSEHVRQYPSCIPRDVRLEWRGKLAALGSEASSQLLASERPLREGETMVEPEWVP